MPIFGVFTKKTFKNIYFFLVLPYCIRANVINNVMIDGHLSSHEFHIAQ